MQIISANNSMKLYTYCHISYSEQLLTAIKNDEQLIGGHNFLPILPPLLLSLHEMGSVPFVEVLPEGD